MQAPRLVRYTLSCSIHLDCPARSLTLPRASHARSGGLDVSLCHSVVVYYDGDQMTATRKRTNDSTPESAPNKRPRTDSEYAMASASDSVAPEEPARDDARAEPQQTTQTAAASTSDVQPTAHAQTSGGNASAGPSKPKHTIRKLAPPRPFPTVPASVSATGPRSAHTEGKNHICVTRKTQLGAYLRRCKDVVLKDG